MTDQITSGDFCGLCGSFLNSDEDVTCTSCDKEVMGIMSHGTKMKRAKGVMQIDQSGSVVKRFPSISAASKKTGIDISGISRVCSGLMHSAGGFTWGYS